MVKRSGVTEPFSRTKIVAGVRKACQGRPVDEDALALLAQRVEETIRATRRGRGPQPRGRPGHPRPAAGARRGRLPALRQRLPLVRLAGRLRAGDRRAAGAAAAAGADPATGSTAGSAAGAENRQYQPLDTTAEHHQIAALPQPVDRTSQRQPTEHDDQGELAHHDRDRRPLGQRRARRSGQGAAPGQGPARSSASAPPPACTPTTR